MVIDFIYGSFSSGNKRFDFENLYDDQQGLTGSEFSCFKFAEAMAERGHDVNLFVPLKSSSSMWGKVNLKDLSTVFMARTPGDVIYSWNEPNYLRYVPSSSLRMVNMQLNDFNPGFASEGFDEFVDVYTSVSENHRRHITKFTPLESENKWKILPNCIDTSMFDLSLERQPGKMVYCSSADRGLHLLLNAFPKIKEKVPHAELHIFYHIDKWLENVLSMNPTDLIWKEFKNRAVYIKYALKELEGHNVFHHKSVSKNRLYKELATAECLTYPCSTPTYTEGWSVTTLESAYATVPIISKQDALGEIYKNSGALIVNTPTSKNIDKFVNYTIEILTNNKYRDDIMIKTRKFAEEFTFKKQVVNLEQILKNELWERKGIKI